MVFVLVGVSVGVRVGASFGDGLRVLCEESGCVRVG